MWAAFSPGLLQLGDRGPWLAWGLGRNHRWFIPLPVSFHQSFMPVIFGGKHKFLFHLGFLPTWFWPFNFELMGLVALRPDLSRREYSSLTIFNWRKATWTNSRRKLKKAERGRGGNRAVCNVREKWADHANITYIYICNLFTTFANTHNKTWQEHGKHMARARQ